MKTAIIALVLSLFACSAAPDDDFEGAETFDGEELGTVEQPVVALNSTTRQWGTQTGSDRRSCNKTSTGQVCSFAKFKKIEVARNPASWTTDQNNTMAATVSALQNAYGSSGWTFLFTDSANNPPADGVRLLVQKSTTGGGNNGNDISNYRSAPTFFSQTAMTEGAGGGTPVGQYQHHGACSVSIFDARINAKTSVAIERLRLLDHAIGNSVDICMGVGTRSDTANTLARTPINLSSVLNVATTGELCRANIGDMSDLADFSIQTASACAD